MTRVVFYPDRDPDRPGDLFRELVAELELEGLFEIDGDPADADYVAFIGRERAEVQFGRRLKTGPTGETWGGAEVYVLPSTAPEMRRRFYEGVWRSFASHVLGRDLAVRDEFKGLTPEEIKARLDKRRFPFAVLCAISDADTYRAIASWTDASASVSSDSESAFSIAATIASPCSRASVSTRDSLFGKYWYRLPTLTPATSATRFVLAADQPSSTSTFALASNNARTMRFERA